MEISSVNEENLREAAAVGNIDKVETLIRQGVDVNSRNSMNGWYDNNPGGLVDCNCLPLPGSGKSLLTSAATILRLYLTVLSEKKL